MIKKTNDYDIFKFRKDNREKVDQNHVNKIAESIRSKNMLELRPILVNEDMEVIDGQHRLLAARLLQVDIYYQQEMKLDAQDIIKMNINKAWSITDFMNFYCQHEYPEYLKLKEFMQKHELSLKVCISLVMGKTTTLYNDFKLGHFKFINEGFDEQVDTCWETIDYIKKMNGYSGYTESGRFWKSLLRLTTHPDFDSEKWLSNMKKMVSKFSCRANVEEYVIVFQNIYNWRNQNPINLVKDLH